MLVSWAFVAGVVTGVALYHLWTVAYEEGGVEGRWKDYSRRNGQHTYAP